MKNQILFFLLTALFAWIIYPAHEWQSWKRGFYQFAQLLFHE
jgi:hypothetical protein